jgi:hypothetical protein
MDNDSCRLDGNGEMGFALTRRLSPGLATIVGRWALGKSLQHRVLMHAPSGGPVCK